MDAEDRPLVRGGQPTDRRELKRPRTPLDRQRVLAAALRLVDREGLDALSMRRLGRELDVEAMSLYNHVPDKGAILDGLCQIMLAEIAPAPAGADWRESARHYGGEFRRVGTRHPTTFGLFATRPVGAYGAARDMSEAILAGLADAGFGERDAIQAYRTIVRYTLGFTLAEAASADERASADPRPSDESHPLTAQMIAAVGSDDQDDLFTFGLEALLDGLAQRVALTDRPT